VQQQLIVAATAEMVPVLMLVGIQQGVVVVVASQHQGQPMV
jgi:hypothetical protein